MIEVKLTFKMEENPDIDQKGNSITGPTVLLSIDWKIAEKF